MKIKVEYKISLSPLLFGYVDNNVLHFKHIEGIFNEEAVKEMM